MLLINNKMSKKVKIILLCVFIMICGLICALDTDSAFSWYGFGFVSSMNIWIIIEQLWKKKE